ncbi:hypothetical protein [Arthrobacter sp. NicSoilC12]|uniref:hypothetical protein n=1 Tax=Arthrobacter sp. NicSoilC12 TaxID=2831001 RepID=UPI00208D13C1|nr:hypothetical protein [Arthrobacter sp. NicSoilC12]GIU55586.1 hypothetical protein NicSoilC12_13350 [Arthrobacter sp. NicSoilC12]
MENNQNFQQSFRHDIESDFEADFNDAQDGALYFAVTYLDTDCGRIRTESFDDAAAADRFASRCVAGEDGWAVVDAIPAKERRAAA